MSSSSIPDFPNSQNPDPKTLKDETPKISNQDKKGEDERENGDEQECGFCLLMKGGGCRDEFIAWQQCVEEAKKTKEDEAEKCLDVTAALYKCMKTHSDYYDGTLRAAAAFIQQMQGQ